MIINGNVDKIITMDLTQKLVISNLSMEVISSSTMRVHVVCNVFFFNPSD